MGGLGARSPVCPAGLEPDLQAPLDPSPENPVMEQEIWGQGWCAGEADRTGKKRRYGARGRENWRRVWRWKQWKFPSPHTLAPSLSVISN